MSREEEMAIATLVRDFSEHELKPMIRKFDDQPVAGFPSELLMKVEELGFTSINLPEECGGTGLELADAGMVIEELAATCPGFAATIAFSILGMAPLFLTDNKERSKDLYQMLKRGDGSVHSAAISLPETGRPFTVSAVPDGEGFWLTGFSPFVVNGGVASFYTVFAAFGDEIICCLVPGASPGLNISHPIPKLGLNITPCCDLTLENVLIPPEYVISRAEKSRDILNRVETQRHGFIGSIAAGCIQAAIRETTSYTSQRRQGGQFIKQHDAVSTFLADMEVGLETARAVVHQSLNSLGDLNKAIRARIYATGKACNVTTDAVQAFGGYGYMRDLPVEKLMRDSQQLAVIGGSNNWLRIYLQKSVQ